MFPLFFKIVADIVAPKLSITFWRLIRSGSLPVCWRSANVAAVPKGPPSIPDWKKNAHLANISFCSVSAKKIIYIIIIKNPPKFT